MTRIALLALVGCAGGGGESLDDYALPGEDTWAGPELEIPEGFACFADWAVVDGLGSPIVGRVWEGFVDDDPTRRAAAVTDTNGNGIPEEVESWERDAAGRVVRYEVGPGYGAKVVESDWDADGNLLEERTDDGPDGEWDRIDTWTYDADGNQVTGSYDVGADGTFELTVVSEYDADGNLLVQTRDYADSGVEVYTIFLGPDGRRERLEADYGDDGTIDFLATYFWDDTLPYAYTVERDDGNDGTIDAIDRIERDADGNDTYRAVDEDADGTWDSEEISSWTADGELARQELLYENGNSYVVETTWSNGRRLTQRQTWTIDGELALDEQMTATWGGTCP